MVYRKLSQLLFKNLKLGTFSLRQACKAGQSPLRGETCSAKSKGTSALTIRC